MWSTQSDKFNSVLYGTRSLDNTYCSLFHYSAPSCCKAQATTSCPSGRVYRLEWYAAPLRFVWKRKPPSADCVSSVRLWALRALASSPSILSGRPASLALSRSTPTRLEIPQPHPIERVSLCPAHQRSHRGEPLVLRPALGFVST